MPKLDLGISIIPIKKIDGGNKYIIPKNIYQCWISSTKKTPKCIEEAIEKLKLQNQEFKFHIYNDEMCRKFIKTNFNEDVLYAYNMLKPEAYKADLWRYCIMYKLGGVYIDCKYVMNGNNKIINLLDKEYFVRDVNALPRGNGEYIQNSLLISKPKNKLYLNCINKIVEKVKKRDVGRCDLDVTGPRFLATQFNDNIEYMKTRNYNKKNLKHTGNGNIYYDNNLFMKIHRNNEYYSYVNKNNRYGRVYPNIYNNL